MAWHNTQKEPHIIKKKKPEFYEDIFLKYKKKNNNNICQNHIAGHGLELFLPMSKVFLSILPSLELSLPVLEFYKHKGT
jgi:hypothetical protein